MFDCPACAANLKFDPATQDLSCTYCGNHYDVHAFDEDKGNAEENQFFEATVYTCPQCGGELISTDNEAAVFCSYCGASNILESKLRQEKRPKRIIPFQITKEECKKKFVQKVKSTGFAPKALTDPTVIDSFRGIYMPYWAYTVEQHGNVKMQSRHMYQRGDYEYTDHYAISGQLDASYDGFARDSSSSFNDEISDSIAPYEHSAAKDFTPAYMSGFYADVSDVDEKVYEEDARELANKESRKRIASTVKSHPSFKGSLDDSFGSNAMHTQVTNVENVMYPVWFFSYRSGDRVSYAAINGQTGKVMADVPIEKKKYYLTSFVMMVPIFILLNLFLTITQKWTLGIATAFAVLAFIMTAVSKNSIAKRENRSEDRGFMSKKYEKEAELRKQEQREDAEQKEIQKKYKKQLKAMKNQPEKYGKADAKEEKEYEISFGVLDFVPLVLAIVGWVVLFMAPVSDLWYYGCTILILASILMSIVAMIGEYNLLSTHKLPQFDRTGGDDRA